MKTQKYLLYGLIAVGALVALNYYTKKMKTGGSVGGAMPSTPSPSPANPKMATAMGAVAEGIPLPSVSANAVPNLAV